MKYLLGNTVINGDQIVKVAYFPETPENPDPAEQQSACGIETVNDASDIEIGNHHGWSVWLRGKKADLFWEAYSGDAYHVFIAPKAEVQS